jgi:hypothetical protein
MALAVCRGFIDRTGNLAIPARFGGLWEFEDGLPLVELTASIATSIHQGT